MLKRTPKIMIGKSYQRATKVLCAGLLGLMFLPGCTREGKFNPVDMWNRSRLKPYEPIGFFDDQLSSRPLPANTVPRGGLRTDDAMYRGTQGGRFVTALPAAATRGVTQQELLLRGQERYNIYCLPCHGATGHGDGMIVQRGFSPPPDYRIARLREAPVGHFFDVITNGYGTMYSYANRVEPRDRWAIAAYIRELQRVQPQVVTDVRFRPQTGRNMMGGSARGNTKNGAPVGGTGAISSQTTIGTRDSDPTKVRDNSGSSSRVGQPDQPGPKNPQQSLPAPGPMSTPGTMERTDKQQ